MSQIDLQLGGAYAYQWECAVLLALNYLWDVPLVFRSELHHLITDFLREVEAIHLEGETREQPQIELEDINLLSGDRRICIQVKCKEAEGSQWAPGDPLLAKALYRFYCNQVLEQDEPRIRFVFLSNRGFNPDLVQLKRTMVAGTTSESKQAGRLFHHVQKYVARDQSAAPPLDEQRFRRVLNHLALIEFLPVDAVEAIIKAKLQAAGAENWQQAYDHLYTAFSKGSVLKGGTRITRSDLTVSLERFSAGPPSWLPTVALHQLPPDIADFTGRLSEIELLVQGAEAAHATVVISAVAGMAGVGKSALAIHVAHQIKDRFPGAQLYVNLRSAGGEPLNTSDVLAGFLRSLGVQDQFVPQHLWERENMYRSLLADKRALIVLDNAHDEAQVRSLLPASDSCAVLITSRKQLSALEGIRVLDLEVLDEDEALALLAHVAGEARIAAEPDAAARIAALCGRLPLAIRIAGGRLRSRPLWNLHDYASQLADEAQRLAQLRLGDLEVRASFALSYQGLSLEHSRLFRLLALLAGADFSSEVAGALLGVTTQGGLAGLEALVDAQLVEPSGVGRYRMHDLMRLFARERLEGEEPADVMLSARTRAARWYLEAVSCRSPWVTTGELPKEQLLAGTRWDSPSSDMQDKAYRDVLLWFDAERLNLLEAMKWAYGSGELQTLWELSTYLSAYFELRALWADWQWSQELALKAARQSSDWYVEAHALANLGLILNLQGRWAESTQMLEFSLQILQREEELYGVSRALNILGVVYLRQNKLDLALHTCSEALEIVRKLGNRQGESAILSNLADVLVQQSEWEKAEQAYYTSLAIEREMADRIGEAKILNNLGLLYTMQESWPQAESMFRQSLEILQRLDDRYWLGKVLANLGFLYDRQLRAAEASAHWRLCLDKLPVESPEHQHVRMALAHGWPGESLIGSVVNWANVPVTGPASNFSGQAASFHTVTPSRPSDLHSMGSEDLAVVEKRLGLLMNILHSAGDFAEAVSIEPGKLEAFLTCLRENPWPIATYRPQRAGGQRRGGKMGKKDAHAQGTQRPKPVTMRNPKKRSRRVRGA